MEPKSVGKLLSLVGFSLAAGAVLCLAGCENCARHVATYHPPVIQTPAIQAPVSQAPVTQAPVIRAATAQQPNPPTKPNPQAKAAPRIGALPLGSSRGRTAYLALMPPDAVQRLPPQLSTLFPSRRLQPRATPTTP